MSFLAAAESTTQRTLSAPASNHSGFFYDPSHDGEGFVIEVTSDERAAIYWFTYDNEGNQRWFIGVGTLDATGITVADWYTSDMMKILGLYDQDDDATSDDVFDE